MNCVSQKAEKLPEIPWKTIVKTHHSQNICLWRTDINIKLFGNFTSSDSLMIENAILKLNGFTETIQLKLSNQERGNLEMYFLDSTNYLQYAHFISLTSDMIAPWSFTMLKPNAISLFTYTINTELINDEFKQNYLTNTLAFALYPVYWTDNDYYEKNRKDYVPKSIHESLVDKREELYFKEMQEFDIKLLTEVYSVNFNKNLAIGEKQFQPSISVPNWLKVNPYAFLVLPFGIILFLLFPLFMKISEKIAQKVKNVLLRFNINGLIGVLIVMIISYFYFTLSYKIRWGHFSIPPVKGIIIGTLLSVVIGLFSLNMIRFIEIFIHKNTQLKSTKIVLIFMSTGLIPFSAILAIYSFVLNGSFSSPEIKGLSYLFLGGLIIGSFRALISYFFFKEKDMILENETKFSKLRELKSKAELNALHSRINPHFLYNSLNSIAGLAHENADQTEHMALSLSKLFRYSINKEQSDWTTFKEELEMVRIYLDVEKVRFGDRLTYSVNISKELEEHEIPRFIIQPLVENAVKHGISNLVEGGEIKVSITKEGSSILITVSDSGHPFPADLIPGFGLQSIYDKLEILYSNRFEMSFLDEPVKQVKLKLE